MKKFLFIHDISQADLLNNKESYINNFSNWVRCFTDWENTTEVAKWGGITPQQCQEFEYVMLLLMTDQRDEKLNKFLEIVAYPERKYKTIMYVDGVVGWQMNPFIVPNKEKYMDIVNASDYVFHYGLPESEGYWQVITRDRDLININRPHPIDTIKRVYDIEHPIDTEYIKQFTKEQQNIIVVGKSLYNINEERNAISSLYVAGKLQKITGWPVWVFANNPLPTDEVNHYYKSLCGIDEIKEIPVMPWNDYIKVLGICTVGIHLDCLETRGQFALDCAGLKIPLVCSGSVAGYNLYPQTWIPHCRNIENALKKAYRLVQDKAFRKKVVDFAYKTVETYSFIETKKKLEGILGITI